MRSGERERREARYAQGSSAQAAAAAGCAHRTRSSPPPDAMKPPAPARHFTPLMCASSVNTWRATRVSAQRSERNGRMRRCACLFEDWRVVSAGVEAEEEALIAAGDEQAAA